MEFWHWLIVAGVFAVIEGRRTGDGVHLVRCRSTRRGRDRLACSRPCLEHQALIFAALALASVAIGRMAFARIRSRSSGSRLNRRAQTYVGRTFTLERPIVDGRGRLRVDDTMWLVEGPDLPAGTRVRVTGADSTLLRVAEL